jgi:hypothetical protein
VPVAPEGESGEHLAANRHVTLLLRLVADPDGHLVHGEVVDSDGATRGKFASWTNLVELLVARLNT